MPQFHFVRHQSSTSRCVNFSTMLSTTYWPRRKIRKKMLIRPVRLIDHREQKFRNGRKNKAPAIQSILNRIFESKIASTRPNSMTPRLYFSFSKRSSGFNIYMIEYKRDKESVKFCARVTKLKSRNDRHCWRYYSTRGVPEPIKIHENRRHSAMSILDLGLFYTFPHRFWARDIDM